MVKIDLIVEYKGLLNKRAKVELKNKSELIGTIISATDKFLGIACNPYPTIYIIPYDSIFIIELL